MLQTQRLNLEPLSRAHVESMHALSVDPDVRRYLFKDRVIPISQVDELREANVDLEVLAEGGDNGDFLTNARSLAGVHTTRTGTAPRHHLSPRQKVITG